MLKILKIRWKENAEKEELEEELREVSELIERSEALFNEAQDGDLIESAIYERSSHLARYAYLMKELKKRGDMS